MRPIAQGLSMILAAPSALAAFAPDCPSSPAEWEQWRARTAESLASGATKPRVVAEAAYAKLERCRRERPGLFTSNPGLEACLANLRDFVRAIRYGDVPPHSLGFQAPDAAYLRETAALTAIPPRLRQPGFLRLASDPALADEAVRAIDRENRVLERKESERWIAFRFVSRYFPSPDESRTLGRLLVHVPGNPARTVLYSLLTPQEKAQGKPPANVVAVIAARPRPEGGADVFFNNHWKIFESGRVSLTHQHAVTPQLDKCQNCHKSGLIPVHPASFSPADRGKLEAFNRAILAFAPARFGPHLDPEAHGPPMGPNDARLAHAEARSDAFFERCTSGLRLARPAATYEKLRGAMACARCHHPGAYGSLNFPMARFAKPKDLVRSFIAHSGMPPGTDLDSAPGNQEREALFRCLREEYYGEGGTLRAWLERGSCGE